MTNNIFILLTTFLPIFAAVITLFFANQNKLQRLIAVASGVLTVASAIIVFMTVFSIGTDSPLLSDFSFGVQTYRMGGYEPPYGIVLVADKLSSLFAVMTSTVMLGGLFYVWLSKEKSVTYPAFIPLFLIMQAGLNGSILTGDLFTFFVFLELMVLSSVSLVAVSDNEFGLEAAIKYVFISGMGTIFLLLGISAMYITFGTLNMAHMGQLLAINESPLLARGAAIMLLSSFLLKSAVFPFHFWQPDFHTTAPTAVSAMLSSVIVKVGIYMIIRMTTLLFNSGLELEQIRQLVLILGITGIFYGSFAALRTYNGKRMLAYSTIGQVGFILIAIGWGTELALAAAIVYSFNHAFIKSSLLMIMGIVASYSHEHSVDFKDIEGMGHHVPTLVGMLWFLGGMSLAGLPPMNGFISKLFIVQSGVDAARWLTVGLAVFSGSLTLMYMFRTWQRVFQQKKEVTLDLYPKGQGDGILAPAFLITICVILGIFAQPLIGFALETATQLGDPSIYIEAVNLPDGLFGG